jgi:hypothetical protein
MCAEIGLKSENTWKPITPIPWLESRHIGFASSRIYSQVGDTEYNAFTTSVLNPCKIHRRRLLSAGDTKARSSQTFTVPIERKRSRSDETYSASEPIRVCDYRAPEMKQSLRAAKLKTHVANSVSSERQAK